MDRLTKNRLKVWGEESLGMLLIVAVSLIGAVLLSFWLSDTPALTLRSFFFGPLQGLYFFGNMINGAIPLVFGGLGVSIALKGGTFNLGGEGQIYAGGFVATIVAIALEPLGLAGALLALLAGSLVSGIIGGLSGLFRMKWDTDELITSFLVSNVVLLVIDYLVGGPFMDRTTNLIATGKIPVSYRLPRILEPSNLSAALYVALLAVVLVHIYLYKTKSGYELRLCGSNRTFARYGGIRVQRYTVLPMALSGAFYGLGGGIAVFGTYYACIKDFSSGMGWNGLAVALIARFKPSAVIPAALFFSYIESGARNAMIYSDVTFELASVVQSVVFFLVSSMVLQQLFVKKGDRR
jgi:simple sugar transport system permease protein